MVYKEPKSAPSRYVVMYRASGADPLTREFDMFKNLNAAETRYNRLKLTNVKQLALYARIDYADRRKHEIHSKKKAD